MDTAQAKSIDIRYHMRKTKYSVDANLIVLNYKTLLLLRLINLNILLEITVTESLWETFGFVRKNNSSQDVYHTVTLVKWKNVPALP